MRTEKQHFIVKTQESSKWPGDSVDTHIWLRVLEGEDAGISVSIPILEPAYDDEEMYHTVRSLEDGDIVEAVLEREEKTDSWYPVKMEKIYE